jgi:hypothetical protein
MSDPDKPTFFVQNLNKVCYRKTKWDRKFLGNSDNGRMLLDNFRIADEGRQRAVRGKDITISIQNDTPLSMHEKDALMLFQ